MRALIKRALRAAGYDLRRYSYTTSPMAQRLAIMKHFGIDVVFDIGANTGGFGHALRDAGYRERIVSFEPTRAAHDVLVQAASADPLWEVAPRAAIGSDDGEIDIQIAGNSESSSILPMLEAHSSAAPGSSYVATERVTLRRLDTVAQDHLVAGQRLFVKVDTQGYEEQVLAGAATTLTRAVMLQVELTLVPLYEGQKLMSAMWDMVRGMGFDLWGVEPVFADKRNGRMLQMDGIFCRSGR